MNQPTKPLSVHEILMDLSSNSAGLSAGLAIMAPKAEMTGERTTEIQLNLINQAEAQLIELVESLPELQEDDLVDVKEMEKKDMGNYVDWHGYNRDTKTHNETVAKAKQALIKAIKGKE